MLRLFPILATLAVVPAAGQVTLPVEILVIGDSMSAEYAYEHPFSAPDSNPDNPNTENWVEILDSVRGGACDFGNDSVYPDLRLFGFKYNWGFPGATAEFWHDVLDGDPAHLLSRDNLLDQLDSVDVAVVFVGGNDVRENYGDLYDNAPPAGFKTGLVDDLTFIIDELRDEEPSIPIVLVNLPDLGVTPDKQLDHPDPAKRADASAHIADINSMLEPLETSHNVHIVDLFAATTHVIQTDPVHIGALEMVKASHPENPPEYLFCKLGLHPATGFQALIGNLIMEGINEALDVQIAPLTGREIVADVLHLDPDQPFLDWIATYPGASTDLLADDDHDGLPNIGEFALQTNPLIANPPGTLLTGGGTPSFEFHPDPDGARLVDTIAEESTDLFTWLPVPPARLVEGPGNRIRAELPDQARAFVRLRFSLVP